MNTFQRSALDGKTFEEAVAIIEAAGCTHRIARKDGQPYIGTCDVKINRINLYIALDIVVAFTQG